MKILVLIFTLNCFFLSAQKPIKSNYGKEMPKYKEITYIEPVNSNSDDFDSLYLIACYPFNGNALDEKGGNHAVVIGPTLKTDRNGKSNSAYSFDGVDDIMKFNSALGNFGDDDFSISLWVQISPNNTSIYRILEKRGNCGHENFWSLGIHGDRVFFEIDGHPRGEYNVTYGNFPNDGLWHHVVFSRIKTNIIIYVDGELITNSVSSDIINFNNNKIMKMGLSACMKLDGTVHFKGKLDDIKFYSKGLESSEITKLFTSSLNCGYIERPIQNYSINNDGLIAYYPLDGNVLDASGNFHDGTAYGGLNYIQGKRGLAANFDGVDDYIAVNSKLLEGLSEFSVIGWVYLNQNLSPIHQFNIYRENNNGWYGKGFEVSLGYFGENVYIHSVISNSTDMAMYSKTNVSPIVNPYKWYSFAITRSNGIQSLYLNGDLVSQVKNNTQTTSLINGILGGWYLNNDPMQSGFCKGYLDEIKFYKRALSSSEIMNFCGKTTSKK